MEAASRKLSVLGFVAAQSCGEATFASNGVVFKVIFARNGAVQQYLLAQGSHNQERDHDQKQGTGQRQVERLARATT